MKTILLITLVFLFLYSGIMAQTTYYVSNNGDNNNSGLSEDQAWKTIDFINNRYFSPGDSVLFERGSIFRETLDIHSSGDPNRQITFGAYGKGDKPKILGSTAITSWTHVSGNIWSGDQPVPRNPNTIAYGAQVFFIIPNDTLPKWGIYNSYQSDFANLQNEFEWTWNSSIVYIYSPTDPNARYTKIECPQSEYGIRLNGNAHISIDNLDIRYLVSAGIYETYGNIGIDGLRVTNCHISNIGFKNSGKAYGLSVTSSNAYYAYNTIHDCGRRAISINVYDTDPAGIMKNVLIEHNHLFRGWHTTGVDCINSGNHLVENITIRNNTIAGDKEVMLAGVNPNSNSIFIANQTNGTGISRNIFIYNNIIYCNHGKGIALENIDTAYIVFNTIYGFNPTLSNTQSLISLSTPGNRNVTVKNNIVYNDGKNSYNSGLNTVFVARPESSSFILDYNLYYNTDPNQHVFEFYEAGSYDDEYTMAQWSKYLNDKSPNDAHSPTPADPEFINAPVDFHISPSSPAKNTGTPIPFVFTDFEGKIRDAVNPSIGAYEYANPNMSNAYIIYFMIPGQISSTIDTNTFTVNVLMPYESDLSALTPTILISYGASIVPASGTSQNFSSPVTYTVTSGDKKNTNKYIVKVSIASPPDNRDNIQVTLAPNPTKTEVQISISGNIPSETYYVRIFTLNGNVIYTSPVLDETSITIPLNKSLVNGIYIVELIFNPFISITKKLIISQ